MCIFPTLRRTRAGVALKSTHRQDAPHDSKEFCVVLSRTKRRPRIIKNEAIESLRPIRVAAEMPGTRANQAQKPFSTFGPREAPCALEINGHRMDQPPGY